MFAGLEVLNGGPLGVPPTSSPALQWVCNRRKDPATSWVATLRLCPASGFLALML